MRVDLLVSVLLLAGVLAGVVAAADRLDVVDQREDLGVGARALDHVPEPLVEVAAGADDERGAGDRLDVAGPRLVVVRVGVGRQEPVHVDAVAADVGDHVGRLRRRGDDGEAVTGRRVVAAAGRQQDERHQRGEEQEAAHRRE